MLRFPWVSRLLLVALGVCACGDEGTGPGNAPPSSLSIDVGNDYFRSVRNGSMEPAFDTVAVNGTITWTWVQDGEHGVEFQDQSLPISAVMSAVGSQHSVTFPARGSFEYFCQVHGSQMAGLIVVR